ncbi:MAG: restriction endonuclease [Deltaproteobacteria bacterium]|jgi:hypothetical protein|nr:restriction endonuclease [Deltaproteobacteria bacterium]
MNVKSILTSSIGLTNSTNEPTMQTSSLVNSTIANDAPIYELQFKYATASMILLANFNSFILDWTARFSVGGTHLNFFIVKQLPILQPITFMNNYKYNMTYIDFIAPRALELIYTAWDMESFANELDYNAPPFIWNDERRFLIRCELDAIFFHLYLGDKNEWRQNNNHDLNKYFATSHDVVDYVMDTFTIVKRNDEKIYNSYRTKNIILEIYDEMAEAIHQNNLAEANGQPATANYKTRLNPPPGPPLDVDGFFIPLDKWDPAHWPPHIHRPR